MISFACACGKRLQVKDELDHKRVKCPACGQVVTAVQLAPTLTPPERTEPRPAAAPPDLTDRFRTVVGLAEPPTGPPGSRSDDTAGGPATPSAPSELTAFLAPPESPGELGRLGGFRILKVLGHGGMGVVYLAEDAQLRRQVALKAMLPQVDQSRTGRDRFLREARAAAGLEHDHIVAIHHVGSDRGVPFMVMPLLRGESLEERLRRPEPVPLALTVQVGREVAAALAAAHAAGLLHRDIKPANLFLEARGSGTAARVKVLDFGLARPAVAGDEHMTESGALLGTPGYMPPEQVDGETLDGRADLFSLGCVLYRMAAGKPAFTAATVSGRIKAVLLHDPPPPHTLNPQVPRELSALIVQLLAKQRDARPASAQAVAARLAAIHDAIEERTDVLPAPRLTTPPARKGKPANPALQPAVVRRFAARR